MPTDRATARRLLLVIVCGTVLSALLSGTLVVLLSGAGSWGALLVFPALAVLAELFGERVYSSTTVSLSAVPVLAAAAAGEPKAAVLAALAAGLTTTAAAHSRRAEQYAFNASALVVCASLAAGILSVAPPGRLPAIVAAALVAALLYYAVDNGLVALVVGVDQDRPPGEVLRSDLGWLMPSFAAYGVLGAVLGFAWSTSAGWGVVAFLVPPALLRLAQHQYLRRTAADVARLQSVTEDLSRAKALADGAAAELADRYRMTASALASAIDARDATTGGHVERVAALGQALVEQVDPELAADPQLAFAMLLHDVGKIGVPDAVLRKPGPLDPAERAVMATHPDVGWRIVTDAGFSPVVAELVLAHHERWDGGGYPQGLRGERIPLAARLFAVADALDAMTSDRPYRTGLPLEEALAELRRHAGTQFDPRAVAALHELDRELIGHLLRLPERSRVTTGV